ncbi:hypothetical protein GIB67_025729 [Kingdonia uniflora]|uniref:Uncharacterized protein n=1 Tax=Kingdonia uniflora TaxID=39325 RepID=A0A7J7KWH8_9MAGN|nr:hypothetical protein GIB67_025729 [Kingdonia uniflora]
MMRVCEALNEKWRNEGSAKKFTTEDVLTFYKFKYMEGRNSGYLYSDSARPKFFDFESSEPKPLATPDKTSLFDCVTRDQNELTEVLSELGIRRHKRTLKRLTGKGRKSAHQSSLPIEDVSTEQGLVKPAVGDLSGIREVGMSVLGDVEKSLKRKRHVDEDSGQTKPLATAKMQELEQRYCQMAKTDPQKLDDEYLEHTFVLSTMLKGAMQCMDKRSPKFDVLMARFEAQSVRMKELEGDLQIEKEGRAADTTAAVVKYNKLAKHLMSDAVATALVERDHFINSYYCFGLTVKDVELAWNGKYAEIELPAEEEEVAGDAAGTSEKIFDLPSGNRAFEKNEFRIEEVVRLRKKIDIEMTGVYLTQKMDSFAKDEIGGLSAVDDDDLTGLGLSNCNSNTYGGIFRLSNGILVVAYIDNIQNPENNEQLHFCAIVEGMKLATKLGWTDKVTEIGIFKRHNIPSPPDKAQRDESEVVSEFFYKWTATCIKSKELFKASAWLCIVYKLIQISRNTQRYSKADQRTMEIVFFRIRKEQIAVHTQLEGKVKGLQDELSQYVEQKMFLATQLLKEVAARMKVDLAAVQSQCDALRVENKQVHAELRLSREAEKFAIAAEEILRAEMSGTFQEKEAAMSVYLRKIESLEAEIRKKDVEVRGELGRASQQGSELLSIRTQIAELRVALEAEGNIVKELQF